MHDALGSRGQDPSKVEFRRNMWCDGRRVRGPGGRGPAGRAKQIGLHSEGGGRAWRIWAGTEVAPQLAGRHPSLAEAAAAAGA